MRYKTIADAAQAEIVVKRSRFIAHIQPVKDSRSAADFLAAIKTKHWDAAHNVYAYVLREGQTRRYSDDGEPSSTAGLPVLEVLLNEELTDCAVVITRYFGGVLLGTGGLVRAYSQAARSAVDAAETVTMALCAQYAFACDYTAYGRVSALIPEYGGVVENTDFGQSVTVQFRVAVPDAPRVIAALTDASAGQLCCEKIGELYAKIK